MAKTKNARFNISTVIFAIVIIIAAFLFTETGSFK